MKKNVALVLKTVIILAGIMVLVFLIRFPQTEGRAANLDLIRIYADPFIIYIYIAAIPFFLSLYQVLKLLGYVSNNKLFSPQAVKAVARIKYYALALIVFFVGAVSYIAILSKTTNEDGAGAIALGLIILVITGLVSLASAIIQKKLQKRVDNRNRK